MGKTFGIVTDAEKWYFLECSLDEQDKLRFKLSKPVIVVYDNEDMERNVKRILGYCMVIMVIGGVTKAGFGS